MQSQEMQLTPLKNHYSSRLALEKMEKNYLWIINSQYFYQHQILSWTELIPSKEEWQVQCINLSKYCFKNIPHFINFNGLLNCLTLTKFPYLVQLNLDLNGTTSIESLYKLNALCLNSLSIKSDIPLQLKNLRKGYFPVLCSISISSKEVHSWEWVNQIHQKKLERITLETQDAEESSSYAQVSVLCKLRLPLWLTINNICRFQKKKVIICGRHSF